MHGAKLMALLLVGALLGCSSATIDRYSGVSVDGMIVGGNRDHLYVLRDDDSMVKVRRSKVKDIDHPGNVLMIIGLPLVGMGLTYALTGAGAGANTTERDMFYSVGGVYGAIGAALAIPGYISWSSSKAAADPEDNIDTSQFGDVPEAPDREFDARFGILGRLEGSAALPAVATPTGMDLQGGTTP